MSSNELFECGGLSELSHDFIQVRLHLNKLHTVFKNAQDVNFLAAATESYVEIIDNLILESSNNDMIAVSYTCEFIKGNISEIDFTQKEGLEDTLAALNAWPILVQNYLTEPEDDMNGVELINLMSKLVWPHPLPNDMTDEILQEILNNCTNGNITVDQKVSDVRVKNSLITFPKDTNQELISEYIAEAKYHIGKMRVHIAYLARGNEIEENAISGLRLAHTLKGTSNIVGVVEISDILHYFETVLELGLDKQFELSGNVGSLLLNASDCLMKMIESIELKTEPPIDYGVVLDNLIRCSRGECRVHSVNTFDDIIFVPVISDTEADSEQNPAIPDNSHSYTSKTDPSAVDTACVAFGAKELSSETVEEMKMMLNESSRVHDRLQYIVDTLNENGKLTDEQKDELDQYGDEPMNTSVIQVNGKLRIDNYYAELNQLLEQQFMINHRLNEIISTNKMLPIEKIFNRLRQCVKHACENTQKEAELALSGENILVDSITLHRLTESAMHLLHNAVDHGLESMKTRVQRGKNFIGKIELSFTQDNYNSVIMRCIDDGQGLDYEKIKKTAIRKGLMQPEDIEQKAELAKFIFEPGFTTRSNVSPISGRGMGMDVVYQAVQELGGSVDILDHADNGTEVVICIPRAHQLYSP